MKSQYNFGGSELDVYKTQKYFLNFFAGRKNVLDLGCGRGVFMEMLKGINVKSIGVDNSDESIKCCKEKNLNVYKSNIVDFLNKNKNKFDGIFLGHIIEHFSVNDAKHLLHSCYNSLSDEGVLGIITPNSASFQVMSEIFWLDPTHVRPYPLLLLSDLLKEQGFKIVDSCSLISANSIYDYLKRSFESIINLKITGINSYIVAKK
ncbi:MAG: methyltransferase domain-containing protein [Patescibacteria group bacterium]|jgi:2-polyprenyl-3-methyl-5-hydroxy-6-metoxy-1,4-benzoquinol methylase